MAASGIDFAILKKRCLGNAALATELLDLFARTIDVDAAALKTALDRGDVAGARAVVHKMKGAAGTVAAQRLHGMLVAFEHAPASDGFAAIATEIAACHATIARPPA